MITTEIDACMALENVACRVPIALQDACWLIGCVALGTGLN